MGVRSSHTVQQSRQSIAEISDRSHVSQLIPPSRVLSADQRQRFESKSNMNQAIREIRECGILWNYTEAFRDRSIFQLPRLIRKCSYQRLPIYSIGCSTGQEPYSLHLVLRESFGDDYSERFPITGYDCDEACIDSARTGCLHIDSRDDSSEMTCLRRWMHRGIRIDRLGNEHKLVTVPDYHKVTFEKKNVKEELFDYSAPTAIFLQNVLYHLSFEGQFNVMDRLCSLPARSIVCLGTDTFTDRIAASILCKSGAFSRVCELKNMLMRRDSSIDSSIASSMASSMAAYGDV